MISKNIKIVSVGTFLSCCLLVGCGSNATESSKQADLNETAQTESAKAPAKFDLLRDFYWGENIQEVQKAREAIFAGHLEDLNSDLYAVPLKDGEDNMVLGFEIEGYQAWVWNNELWCLDIIFKDQLWTYFYYDSLQTSITNMYGQKPVQADKHITKWLIDGNLVALIHISNGEEQMNIIEITSPEIFKKIKEGEG